MTFPIVLLLALTIVAMVLFAVEIISADVVALGLLLALTLTGLLPTERAFAGFGSDTVIVILGLLILTTALLRTGVMDIAGRAILRHKGDSLGRCDRRGIRDGGCFYEQYGFDRVVPARGHRTGATGVLGIRVDAQFDRFVVFAGVQGATRDAHS